MFKLYTKAELIQLFPLQFVRIDPDFSKPEGYQTLPDLGECYVSMLPIRFIADKHTDVIVGFTPKELGRDAEPACYAFLSEMYGFR